MFLGKKFYADSGLSARQPAGLPFCHFKTGGFAVQSIVFTNNWLDQNHCCSQGDQIVVDLGKTIRILIGHIK
jgi:hypothetical protein